MRMTLIYIAIGKRLWVKSPLPPPSSADWTLQSLELRFTCSRHLSIPPAVFLPPLSLILSFSLPSLSNLPLSSPYNVCTLNQFLTNSLLPLSLPLPSTPSSGQTYGVTVHSNPDTNDVLMLTNVTLSCRIHPLPPTYHYFEWTSSDNGFYSSRYANLSTIYIPWFRPENNGNYKCTVYLGNGLPLPSGSRSLRAQGCYMDCCCLRLFVCLFTL